MQSPIDFVGPFAGVEELDVARNFQPVEMLVTHQPSTVNLLDNGHTIQVSFDEGNSINVGDTAFALVQYHFHASSEHTVNGQHFPLEVHFVHASEDAHLAVAGVFIEEGAHNPAVDPIWTDLPNEVGESRILEGHDVDLDSLVPSGGTYARYQGSLTTPPCSEGVSWLVRQEPISMSAEQIATFTAMFNHNNRPVQPINDREVMEGKITYRE